MSIRTVLIIDDSTEMLQALRLVLGSRGIGTKFARNAAQAYAILAESAPDFVLLDIKMPGMNGLKFLEVMRGHPQWRGVPVIVISGQDDPGSQFQAWKLGAKKFLVKSQFSIAELMNSMVVNEEATGIIASGGLFN